MLASPCLHAHLLLGYHNPRRYFSKMRMLGLITNSIKKKEKRKKEQRTKNKEKRRKKESDN
jgi:hypothetical protein